MTTSTLTARLPVRPTPADDLRAIALRVSRLGVGGLTSPTPGSRHRCWVIRDLRSYLGRHQTKPIDPDAEKHIDRPKHCGVVVAQQHSRLTWVAREFVPQLGDKLYRRPENER